MKTRDGKVANRPLCTAVAVTTDSERDILGLSADDGGEGAKFWLGLSTEIKNQGIDDVCIVVCDGFKALRGHRAHLALGGDPDLVTAR